MTLTSKVLKEITQLDTIKTFTNLGSMKKKKKTFNSTFIFIAIYRTKIISYLSVTLSTYMGAVRCIQQISIDRCVVPKIKTENQDENVGNLILVLRYMIGSPG